MMWLTEYPEELLRIKTNNNVVGLEGGACNIKPTQDNQIDPTFIS